jgi:serine protease
MPIRVLDSQGFGDADDIARGVRYAVRNGADVVNLSMEFDPRIRGRDVPSLVDALRFAYRRGVTVVAAAGNQGTAGVPYPARYETVIAVGATTIRRCAANYSNYGSRVDLVAPGGGSDADLPDPGCDPTAAQSPEILQMTFFERRPRAFGFPPGYQGTSMAAPHVSAAAALVIASRVIGRRPSPRAVLRHLQRTTQELGPRGKDKHYGAGLLDAAAATAPR